MTSLPIIEVNKALSILKPSGCTYSDAFTLCCTDPATRPCFIYCWDGSKPVKLPKTSYSSLVWFLDSSNVIPSVSLVEEEYVMRLNICRTGKTARCIISVCSWFIWELFVAEPKTDPIPTTYVWIHHEEKKKSFFSD